MHYVPIPENAARQVIDSGTVFAEFLRVRREAAPYAGGMYWKRQGPYEYLVRTAADNGQKRIGPRNAETEKTYQEFTHRKHEVESRLKSLREALVDAERMNKALKAGRVPSTVVAVLQALDDFGLGEHFVVVGTHALYAYEAAAGVRTKTTCGPCRRFGRRCSPARRVSATR